LSTKKITLIYKVVAVVVLWLGGVYALDHVQTNGRSLLQFSDKRTSTVTAEEKVLTIAWPSAGAEINNLQSFRASLSNTPGGEYLMFWQVDDGQYNPMSGDDLKTADVDLSTWDWRGRGPYVIQFVAQTTGGVELGKQSVQIFKAGASEENNPTENNDSNGNSSGGGTNDGQGSTGTTTPGGNTQTPGNNEPPLIISQTPIDVWWPTDGSTVTGTQPLKAYIHNTPLDSYSMTWRIGNDAPTTLENNYTEHPHKEVSINFDSWTWNGAGPYVIRITAKNNSGEVFAEKNLTVYTNGQQSGNDATSPITRLAKPEEQPNNPPQNTGNPLSGMSLFISNTSAQSQANAWRSSRPQDAALMDLIARNSQARWFGDWNSNVQGDVSQEVSQATSQGKVATLVVYNVPGRDCGSHSAGGSHTANAYRSWIQSFASGIGNRKAIVILEPDGISSMDCLSAADKATRMSLISEAVSTLKNSTGAIVYIDAGHSGWISVDEMANRLRGAGIDRADGFALNVSNFVQTAADASYGKSISQKVNNKHFVIDTSRNGNGSNGEWCNPWGRALGKQPTTNTGDSNVDAYLWLKRPGESDGSCNGGPNAGVWWPEMALELAKNAHY
jgi:endoglucanase